MVGGRCESHAGDEAVSDAMAKPGFRQRLRDAGRVLRFGRSKAFFGSAFGGGTGTAGWWGAPRTPTPWPQLNPDEALAADVVWGCVRIIAEAIGATEWRVQRRVSVTRPGGGRNDYWEDAPEHAANRLLRRPSAVQTAIEFRETIAANMALRRISYALITHSANGVASELLAVPFWNVQRYPQTDGVIKYKLTPDDEELDERRLLEFRMLTFDGLTPFQPMSTLSPLILACIEAASECINTFRNAPRLSGTLESPADSERTPQEYNEFLKALYERFAGADAAGKVMPLPPGVVMKPWFTTPRDRQLVELWRQVATGICAMFGVPPTKLFIEDGKGGGGGSGGGQRSREEEGREFVRQTLIPYTRRISERLATVLFAERDRHRYRVAWDFADLMAADTRTTADAAVKLAQFGVISAREARRMMGLPFRADAPDDFTPPPNMASREGAPDVKPPGEPGRPPGAGDDDDDERGEANRA